jgi:hypothetical protein
MRAEGMRMEPTGKISVILLPFNVAKLLAN